MVNMYLRKLYTFSWEVSTQNSELFTIILFLQNENGFAKVRKNGSATALCNGLIYTPQLNESRHQTSSKSRQQVNNWDQAALFCRLQSIKLQPFFQQFFNYFNSWSTLFELINMQLQGSNSETWRLLSPG